MSHTAKLLEAKKAFLLDLQKDKDYKEHKENAIYSDYFSYGTANVTKDNYCKDKDFSKIVRKFLKNN